MAGKNLERAYCSLIDLNRWLIANKLSLNIAIECKTEFMVIGSRQCLTTFNSHELRVTVDDEPARQVNSTKTLGLTLDENLTWKNHVEDIFKKISSSIRALKRVRGLIDQETVYDISCSYLLDELQWNTLSTEKKSMLCFKL